MRVHQVIKERYMRLQKAPNDADHAGRIFVRLALCWYSYVRQYHTRSSVHVSTTDVPLVRCFIGAYYALCSQLTFEPKQITKNNTTTGNR